MTDQDRPEGSRLSDYDFDLPERRRVSCTPATGWC